MMIALVHVCLSMAIAAPGASPDTRGLIEQALDEPGQITLEQITLRDAIDEITKQTGVKIIMSYEVMDFVPHGPETLVERVEIADRSLREGLTEFFSRLGMTFVVQDGFVEVIPKEALLCLGRPATWAELDTLYELSNMQPGVDRDALSRLQARAQFQLAVPDAWTILSTAIRNVGAGPGDQVLTVACANLGWAWCLSDQQIVIGSVESLIRRQLQQPIDIRMNSRTLIDVLQQIGNLVHVAVRAEPGAIRSLPLHLQKNISVNASHQSAEQVLEQITALTGLNYLINPDGVLFYATEPVPVEHIEPGEQRDAASFEADPYMGKLIVPLGDGTSVEWLIRRSELPIDLREMREDALREAFEALRQAGGMKDEG